MKHRARKRFGQHFLTSPEIIEQIVSAIGPRSSDIIVEIGPGQAAITDPLSILSPTLHAIELDRDLVRQLERRFNHRDNVHIHEADALSFDYTSLGNRIRLVGNLPYNISTPLLFKLIAFRDVIVDMHFMFQKEVVDRICATPGNKNFGRLTIMLGCRMEAISLFDVPPGAFSPPPRVLSSIVRIRPLPAEAYDVRDDERLETIVTRAFSRRRKTLRNALNGIAKPQDLDTIGLDAGLRPEQVSIDDWVALANHLSA
tara:strand:+ start:190 stop:960 length:771 start_codon:yes stop_codon:yes gene_type:complete